MDIGKVIDIWSVKSRDRPCFSLLLYRKIASIEATLKQKSNIMKKDNDIPLEVQQRTVIDLLSSVCGIDNHIGSGFYQWLLQSTSNKLVNNEHLVHRIKELPDSPITHKEEKLLKRIINKCEHQETLYQVSLDPNFDTLFHKFCGKTTETFKAELVYS